MPRRVLTISDPGPSPAFLYVEDIARLLRTSKYSARRIAKRIGKRVGGGRYVVLSSELATWAIGHEGER